MSLVACPECKGQLSEQALACPHCGCVARPIPAEVRPSLLQKFVDRLKPLFRKFVDRLKPDLSRLWREHRRSFAILAVVLLATMILGVIVGASLGQRTQIKILQFFQKAMGGEDETGFLDLFTHNVSIALMILGSGLWLRGLPGFIVGLNGFVLGLVVAAAGGSLLGTVVAFLLVLPHGVFELPALVGSGGLALLVNRWKRAAPEGKVHSEDVRWVARCFGLIVVLLVIAAAIEAVLIAAMSPSRGGNPWE